MLYDMLMCSVLIRHYLILFSFSHPALKRTLSLSPIYSLMGYLSVGLFLPFSFSLYLWLIVSLSIPLLFCCLIPAHSFTLDLLCSLTLILLCSFFLQCRDIDSFVEEKNDGTFSLSLSRYPFFAGPCVLWSSWRFLRTAATGPALSPPRHALIWPRSWRSTLRCPSIMQASTCRCSASPCSPQRCTPAELHPKPSNVSRISYGLWTLCIIHSLQHRKVCKWCALWIVRLRFEILYCRTSRLAVSKFGIVLFN